eukprot:CAMPEP_0197544378 /NCGR_PEP_ID=MMETSP1318-20131121/68738_1 /TAXON_ID=552666 /ORGANISM="Partenskyella glossopodia, Strain RCC365" /LENGTH=49 /DNA_ID=CAMNT_0043103773 /DNA_START=939 /DNA_END=1091 /DNA_ORIENTATION=+
MPHSPATFTQHPKLVSPAEIVSALSTSEDRRMHGAYLAPHWTILCVSGP